MTDSPTGPPRDELFRLLREYNEYPDHHDAVMDEIGARFEHRLAIMVVDTCSFTRTVQDRGLIYFLALLERLERMIAPTVARFQGRILRKEADNFFAIFPTTDQAAECAVVICQNLILVNEPLPTADEMSVSIRKIGRAHV